MSHASTASVPCLQHHKPGHMGSPVIPDRARRTIAVDVLGVAGAATVDAEHMLHTGRVRAKDRARDFFAGDAGLGGQERKGLQAGLQGLLCALVALGWLFFQRDITCTRVCTGDALRLVYQELHLAEFAAVVNTAIQTAKQLLQFVHQELIKLLATIQVWVNRFDKLAHTHPLARTNAAAAAAASAAVPASKTRMAFGVTAFGVWG